MKTKTSPSQNCWYAPYLGAAAGGAIETVTLHWLDTVAKRLQKHKGKTISWDGNLSFTGNVTSNMSSLNSTVFQDAAHLNVSGKMVGLYSGVGFGIGYKVLQRFYKLGTQKNLQHRLEKSELFTQRFNQNQKQLKQWAASTSGFVVGLGEAALLPLDLLKVKYQTNKTSYQGIPFWNIWKKENPFKGLSVTLPRNIVGTTTLFSVREYVKGHDVHSDIANIAGSAASIVVPSPLDVIKTRVQSEKAKVDIIAVAKNTLQQEGFGAFYKGVGVKLLTQGPKLAVCLAVADRIAEKIPQWVSATPKSSPLFFGTSAQKAKIEAEEDQAVSIYGMTP